jgi:hypothetical protein
MEKLHKKIEELSRDILRCRRDLDLICGEAVSDEADFRDQLILSAFRQIPDETGSGSKTIIINRKNFINDLKLKLKIMEKTRELYESEAGWGPAGSEARVISLDSYRVSREHSPPPHSGKRYAFSGNQ